MRCDGVLYEKGIYARLSPSLRRVSWMRLHPHRSVHRSSAQIPSPPHLFLSASPRTLSPQRSCSLRTLASAFVVSRIKQLSLQSCLELDVLPRAHAHGTFPKSLAVYNMRRVQARDTCGGRQGDIGRVQEEAQVRDDSSYLAFYTRTAVPEHG